MFVWTPIEVKVNTERKSVEIYVGDTMVAEVDKEALGLAPSVLEIILQRVANQLWRDAEVTYSWNSTLGTPDPGVSGQEEDVKPTRYEINM